MPQEVSASNAIAGLASFFCPGLGQLIQGRFSSAAFWFLACVGSLAVSLQAFGLILLLLLCVLWVCSIVDAVNWTPRSSLSGYYRQRGQSTARRAYVDPNEGAEDEAFEYLSE